MSSFEPGRKRGAEYHIFGAACGRDSRERESKRALFEHDPYSITGGPMAGRTAENVGGCERMERNIVDASVVLGSSERESDDSVSVGIPILCETLCTVTPALRLCLLRLQPN